MPLWKNELSMLNVTIQSVNTINNSSYYMFDINLLVDNVEKLDKFMNEIRKINGIVNIERIVK